MNKKLLISVAIIAYGVLMFLYSNNKNINTDNKSQATIKHQQRDTVLKEDNIKNIPFLKKAKVFIKKVIDKGDYFMVNAFHPKAGYYTLYIMKKDSVVILGSAFDKNGKKLFFKHNMEKYKKYATYTKGNGKKDYYLFIDPQCPYCKRLENAFDSIGLDSNVSLHVFIYTLPYHKNSKKMAYYVLSQKDRNKAMMDIFNKKVKNYNDINYSKEQITEFDNHLAKIHTIGSEVGLSGTPYLVNKDGGKISPAEIIKRSKQ